MSVERFFGDVFETEDIKEMLKYWFVSNTKCCSLGMFEYFTEEYIVDQNDYYKTDMFRNEEAKLIQVKERDIVMSINLDEEHEIYIWYRGSHVKSLLTVIKEILDHHTIVCNEDYRLFYGDFEFITVEAHGHAVTCN